jgi:hypothetical protein
MPSEFSALPVGKFVHELRKDKQLPALGKESLALRGLVFPEWGLDYPRTKENARKFQFRQHATCPQKLGTVIPDAKRELSVIIAPTFIITTKISA